MNRNPIVVALAISAALAAVSAATAARTTAESNSCPPITEARLQSILGLPNVLRARNTVDDSGSAVRYQCNGVAWSGPPPTSREAAFQLAKSGRGAAFGIETWRPNEGSPSADDWPNQYDKLTGGFDIKSVVFPGLFTNAGWPTKRVTPVGLGYQRAGDVVTVGSGPAKGLVAAVGCWWDDNALTAACLLVEEAAGKPVVQHLNALAKIAVPKVL